MMICSRRRNRDGVFIFYFLVLILVSSLFVSNYTSQHLIHQQGEKNLQQQKQYKKTINSNSRSSSKLLLSVPFYVYENMAWVNATYGGQPIKQVIESDTTNYGTRFKHGDDYWFLIASLNHPMRTDNISEAKLFFVPILMNLLDFQACFGDGQGQGQTPQLCWRGKCDYDLLLDAQRKLRNSKAFQRYPERHVAVRSLFSAHWPDWTNHQKKFKGYNKFMELLPKINTITFEGREKLDVNTFPQPSRNRIVLPSYYVGTPCEQTKKKIYDVAMIASLKDDREWFQDRRNICKWLNSTASTRNYNIKSVCGGGEQCPTLAQSKFGIHSAGDTWGSQRLMDTILSGTVPIFTSLDQYEIQGSWIDWRQLSYYLPVYNHSAKTGMPREKFTLNENDDTTEEVFLNGLQKIITDVEGYELRYNSIIDNLELFDYTTLYPFDVYLYFLQARLFPETRKASSQWSALILPPILFSTRK